MKQFHWLLCLAKNRNWSRKIAPLSNLTRASLLVEWKLTAKPELNCEICKSWRKCWKNQVSFCHRSSPMSRKAWTLLWKLQELKNYPRKTCGYGQPRGHLIRVLNERSVNDGTLGSRGYFFLIDISRRSRVNEAQSAEEKKITSGHRSTQPHFHARNQFRNWTGSPIGYSHVRRELTI